MKTYWLKTFRFCCSIKIVSILFFSTTGFTMCSFNGVELQDTLSGKIDNNDVYTELRREIAWGTDDKLTLLYSKFASCCIMDYDINRAKLYLDSAELYLKDLRENNEEAFYYHVNGDLCSIMANDSLSHHYYYLAQKYYDANNLNLVPVLHNLSVSYIHRGDLHNLAKMVKEILELADRQGNEYNRTIALRTALYYYGCLKEQEDKPIEIYNDSIIFYARKLVDIYENNNSQYDAQTFAYDYLALSRAMLNKSGSNLDSIKYYIDKSEKLAISGDTTMLLNLISAKATYEYKTKDYQTSENLSKQQFDILLQWSAAATNLSIYEDIYSLLADIKVAQGDYRQALVYEKEKTRYANILQDENKYKIIEELRKKYKSEQQAKDLKHSHEQNQLSETKNLFLTIACLLLVLVVFFILWLDKIKKESHKQTIELKDKEIKELIAKFKLRRQENINAELKELETGIAGAELEKREKEKLLKKETLRRDRCWNLTEVENMIDTHLQDSYKYQEYKDWFEVLGNNYVDKLRDLSLTDRQISYCIVFVILMTPTDIAKCFNIQVDSVKKRKSNIKREVLDLSEKRTLESFLYDLTLDN